MRQTIRHIVLVAGIGLLAGCASAQPRSDTPDREPQFGIASYYAASFHGSRTASGRRYNRHALTAAHRTLPFGTRVRVTNLENDRSVVVTITDRGPFRRGRILDVSSRAARELGFRHRGTARVRVDILELPEDDVRDSSGGDDSGRDGDTTRDGD